MPLYLIEDQVHGFFFNFKNRIYLPATLKQKNQLTFIEINLKEEIKHLFLGSRSLTKKAEFELH